MLVPQHDLVQRQRFSNEFEQSGRSESPRSFPDRILDQPSLVGSLDFRLELLEVEESEIGLLGEQFVDQIRNFLNGSVELVAEMGQVAETGRIRGAGNLLLSVFLSSNGQ